MLKMAKINPIKTQIDRIIIDCHDKLPKFPSDQKVNFCNCSAVLKYVRTPTIALVKLENISPTIRIAIVSRSFWETTKIASNTKVLPKHDAKIIPKEETKKDPKNAGKNADPKITKATPKLAPELNPSTYGPASGLRNKVCISKPLTDNPIPTKTAVIALGKR